MKLNQKKTRIITRASLPIAFGELFIQYCKDQDRSESYIIRKALEAFVPKSTKKTTSKNKK